MSGNGTKADAPAACLGMGLRLMHLLHVHVSLLFDSWSSYLLQGRMYDVSAHVSVA